jgi:hypothetical protein
MYPHSFYTSVTGRKISTENSRNLARNRDYPADMTVVMPSVESRSHSIAVRQAQSLLRAWVCGDLLRLRAELDRSTFIPAATETHPECEQLELLRSVASQMRNCRDLYAERSTDPQLGLCVDLLVHLASCFVYTD